jgi:4-aminobutyrate aminotransferase
MDRATARPEVSAVPGDRAREWIRGHGAVAAPSEASHPFVWDAGAEARGPFCTDVDGNVFLDFTSHIGAAPLGYNNEKIRERLDEFSLVTPLKIAGQDFYYAAGQDADGADLPASRQLMDALVELTDHYGLDTVFLSNSGAEAVENAMKVAYAHSEVPKYALTFSGAFHGRTLGTLSLTRAGDVYTRKYPEVSGVRELPFCADSGCDAASCECGFFAGGESRLRSMLAPGGPVDPSELAYVALEPVQGVGGYHFPSDAFMREVDEVCGEYDVPILVDEIQTGMGRSGEWWAADHYPIEPDLIASAKALRVGATVGRSDLFPDEKNRLGSTWGGGDVLSSMLGTFTIEAIREYDLLDNATERGEQVKKSLRDADLPGVVDVRGLGLLLAIEFDSAERRDAVTEAAFRRGLLVVGCGERTVRLLPPLDVTEREVDMGVSLLADAVADVATPADAD